MMSFNGIYADTWWNLADDGTLTISDNPDPRSDFSFPQDAPWYKQRDKVKKLVIKEGLSRIFNCFFCDCSNLTSVTISNSVKRIGEKAFQNCTALISVDIPNSVTEVGFYAFSGCTSLTSVTIPASVTSINYTAFEGCTSLATATIGIERIPYILAYSSITTVVLLDGVKSIGSVSFLGCARLKSVILPNSLTKIESKAFENCSSLSSITIPESVTSIEQAAFTGCSALSSINIPESVTSIGDKVFENCTSLTSVTIPSSLTSISREAFSGCSGLTSVTIPNSVKSIEGMAFYKCTALTSINIPNSVTKIGDWAFCGCTGLTSVTIPNSVTQIIDWPFEDCTGLTSMNVEKGNAKYDSRNDCNAIIETASNTLISGCKNTIIPETVTSIYVASFKGCTGLTSIIIPESVTSIGGQAFHGCSGLTSVTIPENVTTIGGGAFLGAKLRNVVIKAKTPPTGGSAFSDQTYYHTTLMIPEGSWDAYAYDDNWYKFINIREVVYNAVNLTNSKAYMMKSTTEGAYLFYDSVNDCVGFLNETALDDTEENNTWMTVEVDGKRYVYNLGAKKFLVSDGANAKTRSGGSTGYTLSDVPVSIDVEDGKSAIVVGKSKEYYMVINDKLNAVEGLRSQVMTYTGIKEINVESNQPTVTYNVTGQIVPDNTKGLVIKRGKVVINR